MIPRIDIAPLFATASSARDAVDHAILDAATDAGFMTVHGWPAELGVDSDARRELLRVFDLPMALRRRLWRRKFDATRPNLYRGWYPAQDGAASYKEGIDMGPDVARGAAVVDDTDPLRETTPLPDEGDLPGWRAAVARYYLGCEALGETLMHAIARALSLPDRCFEDAFRGGISTLRVICYPERTAQSMIGIAERELWVRHDGSRRHVIGRAHCDSGLLTLLAQDGVDGLQARAGDGGWLDVPPADDALAVNFGRLLEGWTGGRLRATEHRVLGGRGVRRSVPFFYEARADALIAPLPSPHMPRFQPFLYGDYLWASTTRFVEFKDMAPLRPPRGAGATAALEPFA